MRTEMIAQVFARTMMEIESDYNFGTDYARRLMIDGAKLMLRNLGYEVTIEHFGRRDYSERHVHVVNKNENNATVIIRRENNKKEE